MRAKKLEDIGIMYMGMGVSGGEEGARNGERKTRLMSYPLMWKQSHARYIPKIPQDDCLTCGMPWPCKVSA